jgi:selenocysteine lyase/cysteine desulfurase
MILPSQRDLFEIPDEITYLNCAYMSPLLRAAREAGEKAIARKSAPWRIAAHDFFEESELLRSLFAELISTDPDSVALIPSASYGLSVAAANLPVSTGQRILLLEDQFPSNVYPWRELADRSGGTIEIVARPPDFDWTGALLPRIDERTAIVAVPHYHWTDGSFIDLELVAEKARTAGAALVVDATQSLGAAPLDLARVRPDFLAAATYKWLLGPYSLGFLYVDPKHHEGRPIEFNWITREGSEDFAGLVRHRDTFQSGARRFDVGERSNFGLLPVAIVALRRIFNWGIPNIAATLAEMTSHIEREARTRLDLQAPPSRYRAPHVIGLRSSTPLASDLPAKLASANVFVSVRGNSIRVSPHLYNTDEDVDRLLAVLAEALPLSQTP